MMIKTVVGYESMEACLQELLTTAGYVGKAGKYTRYCSHGAVVIKYQQQGGGIALRAKTTPLGRHTMDTSFHKIETEEALKEVIALIHL